MANVTVVGAQWGDEGKGKIVDWLTEPRRDRRALPGRPQCRPHARRRRERLQAQPAAVGHRARGVEHHRQRRRARSVASRGRDRQAARPGRDDHPRQSADRRDLPADPALSSRSRRPARGCERRGKIGTTRRGIGPAYEDKVGRRAIRVCDLAHLDDLGPQIERLCAHHDALRAGFGEPPIDRERLLGDLRAIAGVVLPYAKPVWLTLKRGQAGRQAHPVRGRAGHPPRCRPWHLSVRHLVQHDRGDRGGRLGDRAERRRLRARHRQGVHDARRIGAVPDRAGQRRRRAAGHARARVRHGHRTQAALRLVRRGAGAAGGGGVGHLGHRSDQARRARRLRRTEDLRRLHDRRHDVWIICRRTPRIRPAVQPIYETIEGWSESTQGARSWAELPAAAIKYIRRVEELIRCPVALVSTSPERDDTILVRDPFSD